MADKKISALPPASTPLAGTEVLPIVQGGTTDQVSVANLTAGRPVSMSAAAVGATLAPWVTLSPVQTGNGSFSGEASSAAMSHNVYFNGGWKYIASGMPASQYDQYLGTHRWFTATTGTAGGAISFNYVMDLDGSGNLTAKTGNLIIGTAGKGIDFSANPSAPGMTSELLNDYEEGTWTPADASGAGLSFTLNATSYYTKIGNVVTCNLDVTYPATADASIARITLPFAPKVSGAGGNIGYTTKAGGIYVSLSSAGSFTFTDLVSNFLTNANMSTTRSQLSFSYIAA